MPVLVLIIIINVGSSSTLQTTNQIVATSQFCDTDTLSNRTQNPNPNPEHLTNKLYTIIWDVFLKIHCPFIFNVFILFRLKKGWLTFWNYCELWLLAKRNPTGAESICIHHNDEQVSSPTVKAINLIKTGFSKKACGLRFMAQINIVLYQCLIYRCAGGISILLVWIFICHVLTVKITQTSHFTNFRLKMTSEAHHPFFSFTINDIMI